MNFITSAAADTVVQDTIGAVGSGPGGLVLIVVLVAAVGAYFAWKKGWFSKGE